jgi:predicted nucleotide-binding protein (sugar kinase/HSP70/actin superfamily)
MTAQAVLLGLLSQTNARIRSSGIWDDVDWYDNAAKVGVVDGEPYSNDTDVNRRIISAIATEGDVLNYMEFDNVQRVADILPETKYNDLFPMKNALYTYQGFLRAIAKFPKFCGESNIANYDAVMTCKRELSFLFAHFV